MALSFDARRQLRAAAAAGPVRLQVETRSRFFQPATELAVVAEARGSARPEERFVYSAHVQEPGANDDASGVGTLTEMARTLAQLVKAGRVDPKRTITMLWGQEIRVTDRYLKQDTVRLKGVHWGISLDMTGEDTQKTGGTFLIEKMPDPSAIWTRGDDKHTEWGGRPLAEKDLRPHYFNDFLLARCLEQSRATGWVVKTNPFEGGSDHTAYLNNGKPGVLFWHFTDQFYHTDGDRIDMVSPFTLQNVGTAALVSGLTLASADGAAARAIIAELQRAALARLDAELTLSREAIAKGGDQSQERRILQVWGQWYVDALRSTTDIELGGSSAATTAAPPSASKRSVTRPAVETDATCPPLSERYPTTSVSPEAASDGALPVSATASNLQPWNPFARPFTASGRPTLSSPLGSVNATATPPRIGAISVAHPPSQSVALGDTERMTHPSAPRAPTKTAPPET